MSTWQAVGKLIDEANTDNRPTIKITDNVDMWVDRTGYFNFYEDTTDTRVTMASILDAMGIISTTRVFGFKRAVTDFYDRR